MSKKATAIYVRVSTKQQNHESQEADLKRWAESQETEIIWYRDKSSGKTMDRPGWAKLESAMRSGKIGQIVVWRLDRLGRTVSKLSSLFDDLTARKINLVSLKDSVDLSTPAGRLMANVLASVAAYETEMRGERVLAGQAVAKDNGQTWGGAQSSKPGVRKKVSELQESLIRKMKADGESIVAIAKAVGLSRPTIYSVLDS
jgi:DNA invertase Pin-like site-specific DNA recombinase